MAPHLHHIAALAHIEDLQRSARRERRAARMRPDIAHAVAARRRLRHGRRRLRVLRPAA